MQTFIALELVLALIEGILVGLAIGAVALAVDLGVSYLSTLRHGKENTESTIGSGAYVAGRASRSSSLHGIETSLGSTT